MIGVDALLSQHIHNLLVGIVVAEHDDVITVSDAHEQESNRFLELPLALPEIGDVIAELDPLVSQSQMDLAAAMLGSSLFHSNALSPVTACPRIKV